MHVLLMGAQGAGKGTQALRVAPRLGLRHLSTGDLFRAAIASESLLGQQIKAIYDRGDLVPDGVTIGLVEEVLDLIAAERLLGATVTGALLDGFPRTRPQAEGLDTALRRRQERIRAAIEIAVPMDVLITRLAGRRVCQHCGAVYHVNYEPPTIAGTCDRCGGVVIQREDDRPEPIQRRLSLYFEQTAPLLSYYRDQGLLHTVDGNESIDVVTEAIVAMVATLSDAPIVKESR
jgi:adenylate kinase